MPRALPHSPAARPVPPAVPAASTATANTQAVTPLTKIASSGNVAVGTTPPSGPLFHNMFNGDARRGAPVSQVIRDLWATRPTVAAALTGQAPVGAPISSGAISQISRGGASAGLENLYGNQTSDVSAMFGART